VNVQIQEWTNINTKISTALSQNDPPDVVEIGNTDVPLFAAAGALSDITADQASWTRTRAGCRAWSARPPWTARSTPCRCSPATGP
jgi:maltose-binding protein MalE